MKATLLIALMVGLGGTSLAAQNTIPGDMLYPVKVHVNESVRGALIVNANQKATFELSLLEERIDEAKRLQAEGEFHGEVEANVLATIAAQVDRTMLASNEADAAVASEVQLAVSHDLSVLSTRLAIVPTNANARMQAESSRSASMKGDARQGGADDVMTMSAFGTSELAADISVESIIAQADTRLEALQKTIREAFEMSAEVKADFEAKLKTASEFVVQAQAQLQTNAEAQAETSAQKAHEIMGEVESALSLMGEVKIDMNTGHIIGIDLSGSGSTGAGVDGNSGSIINTDIMIDAQSGASVGSDAMDRAAEIDAAGSAEGTIGW